MAEITIHADEHTHHADDHHVVDPGPQRFTMSSSMRTTLLSGIGIGIVCLLLTFFVDKTPFHARFWSNWLHNSAFFMGIGFMSLFLVAAKILMYSGWHTVFKRVWEANAQFLPVAIVLFIPIVVGVWLHWNHIYHWADLSAVMEDDLLEHKSAFLNPTWYTLAAVIIPVVWYFVFALPLLKLSREEDEGVSRDFEKHHKMRSIAGIFLPIAAFSSAAVIWLVIMSVDAHWYSTLFAWYATASWLVATVAITILMLIYLKFKGYYGQVTTEHLHDLGKYMFAFSIFWTYLWFSQFMLIWYGNIGEETVYFQTRMEEFPVVFWANLFINFLLPFFILMANTTKRRVGTLVFVAIFVLFGHWLDFFLMLKPGILHTTHEAVNHLVTDPAQVVHAAGNHPADSHSFAGFTLPGLLEIGTFIGFLSLFCYVAFNALTKANLVPVNDPYIEESLHHHV